MLSLVVDGQPLDLPDDFSITLNLKSPVFNEMGDHSFPFKVPSTTRNMAILGWKNRVASSRNIYESYNGSLRWNDSQLYHGQVMIREAGAKTFDGTLYLNKGYFNFEMKDKILSQMDFGSMIFSSDDQAMQYFNSSLTRFYPDCDFAMPEIVNTQFFEPPTEDIELMSYNHLFTDGLLHKLTSDGKSRTILVPLLYLKYVLEKLASLSGYTLWDEVFSSTTELSRLVVYNSTNLSDQLFGLQQIFYSRLLPEIKVSEFFSGLEKWFNCSIHVDSFRREIRIISNKFLLLSSPVHEFSKNILSMTQEIPQQITGYQFSVSPDSGDKEYQAQLDLEKWQQEFIKGSVATKADIPPYPFTWIGEIYYVVDIDQWWTVSVNPITFLIEWQQLPNGPLLSDKFYYKWAGDKNKYETCFSTLLDKYGSVCCGNLGTEYKKITPRLFWVDKEGWTGKIKGYCSNSNFSLKYPGSTGMFRNFWKDWVEWIMNERKAIRIEKQMDFSELKAFDFTSRYRINSQNYLVSEISVTLKKNMIKPAQLKCFTAP